MVVKTKKQQSCVQTMSKSYTLTVSTVRELFEFFEEMKQEFWIKVQKLS